MTLGELMTLHPPSAVYAMTLAEGRAVLRAVWTERNRQSKFQIEAMRGLLGAGMG